VFSRLGAENGCEIDYEKLPQVFCDDVAGQLGEDVSLVRTYYFGTIPSSRSGFNTAKQRSFYEFLEKSCGYETEIHEVDVGSAEPHADEAWIKMALGASVMFNAALPSGLDIAVLIGDDLDYAPVLRRVRLLGRRIQLVTAHAPDGSPPPNGTSLIWKPRVSDFTPLFIDDHAEDIRLVRELVMRVCKQCGRTEATTWAGPDFFCSHCRGKHRGE